MTVARPTDTPTCATDADYAAGADAWSATPTRVEPDAGDKATGLVPATRPPAQRLNWWIGLLCDWVAWFADHSGSDDEWTYPTPKAITRMCSIVGDAHAHNDAVGVGQAWLQSISGDPEWRSRKTRGVLWVHIPARTGEIVTGVDISLSPGKTQATPSDRMDCHINKAATTDWAVGSGHGGTGYTTLTPAVNNDDGTTAQQVVVVTLSAGHTMAAGEDLYVEIFAGVDGDSFADKVYAVRAHITSPGPR